MIPELVEPRIVKYLYRKSAAAHTPVSGTFELTPMCNMRCEMCYVRMTAEEMEKSGGRMRTHDEWIAMAETAKKQGMLFLLLTGGEPFLYPGFRELYEKLSEMGFVISINTNATMIDERVMEWLVKNPPARMNITLYGASDATYDRLCHNPKGYTQVTHAIQLLREAGITVKLNCSVTPYNIEDLPEMIQYAQDHDLVIQASSYMFPPLRRDEHMVGRNRRFTPEEASLAAAEIVRLQNGDEKFGQYISLLEEGKAWLDTDGDECSLDVTDLKNDAEDQSISREERKKGDYIRCSAGRCAFWITWDGRMLPCGMMTRPVAFPFRDGFEQAWKETGDIVNGIRLPGKCKDCTLKEQCHSCAAMVLTETDTFTEVPEYRCRMTKCYLEACRQVRERAEREKGRAEDEDK